GYFGVRPGHTPLLTALGLGEIRYRRGPAWQHMTGFWCCCEVRPDRVNILAEIGERADDIDVERAAAARDRASQRMKDIKDEAGYQEAHLQYVRAVTRLAVAERGRRSHC